jgi:uncharacterized protein YodC (DUF2158 family)
METFKTGQIVQLKSGGPKMTVKKQVEGMGIQCQWFAGSKLDSGYFPEESLVKPPQEEPKQKK